MRSTSRAGAAIMTQPPFIFTKIFTATGSEAKDGVLEKAIEVTRDIYEDSRWGKPFVEELKLVEGYESRTGSGYVVDCLLSSLDALSSAKDFTKAVEGAIRYGNDTDTTAAVTGGLAGLLYGLKEIPASWRESLRLEDETRVIINRFADLLAI